MCVSWGDRLTDEADKICGNIVRLFDIPFHGCLDEADGSISRSLGVVSSWIIRVA